MGWRIGLLKASYRNHLFYSTINKKMMKEVHHITSDAAGSLSSINVDGILRKNNLEVVEKEFFRNKKNVLRVKDDCGNPLILKIGVSEVQMRLMRNLQCMGGYLCFRVPPIVAAGEDWMLMEEVQGQFLHELYEDSPGFCIEISRRIANDYQHIAISIDNRNLSGDLLQVGQMRLYSRLNIWSKPLVDAGLIDFTLVQQIAQEFQKIVARKGEDFFAWVHGNIIGDHVIMKDDLPYLLDLESVPWVGRGYYDLLRALDFMFLMSQDAERMRVAIPQWINMYTHHHNQEEVRLVFALRNIGILGWDILHNSVPYVVGDIEKKKEIALQFIKREY